VVIAARAVVCLVASRTAYLLSNPWMIGAVGLLIVSSAAMVTTAAKEYSEHRARYELEIQQRLKATLTPLGGPTFAGVDRALRVLRPPSMAAVLIAGQEGSLPAGWDMAPGAVEELPPYPVLSSFTRFGSGADNTAFIVQFGGLLALALGLASVLRDRQRGWADAERATGVAGVWFTASSHLAAGLALFIAVSIWLGALGFVIDQALEPEWADAGETIRMMIPLTWLYVVALYGYGAAIGWQVRAPLRAVVSVAILWVFLVWLGPQLASSWSGWGGLPSRAQIEQDQRDAYAEEISAVEDVLAPQIAARVGDSHRSAERSRRANEAFWELEPQWLRGFTDARGRATALESAWRAETNRISLRLQQAARLSPTTLLPQVLAEISGNGNLTRSRWTSAVEDFKGRLNRVVFDDRTVAQFDLPIDESLENHTVRRHRVIPYSKLPQFSEPVVPLADRWRASSADALVLVLHALFALMIAAVAQRRAWGSYDFESLSSPDVGRP
jgi:hypothetical protein